MVYFFLFLFFFSFIQNKQGYVLSFITLNWPFIASLYSSLSFVITSINPVLIFMHTNQPVALRAQSKRSTKCNERNRIYFLSTLSSFAFNVSLELFYPTIWAFESCNLILILNPKINPNPNLIPNPNPNPKPKPNPNPIKDILKVSAKPNCFSHVKKKKQQQQRDRF